MSATIHPALATGRLLPNVWDAVAILCVFGALVGVTCPGAWARSM